MRDAAPEVYSWVAAAGHCISQILISRRCFVWPVQNTVRGGTCLQSKRNVGQAHLAKV